MNFHEQISAWQSELAGASRGGPSSAAPGQAGGDDARHGEALRLFEALSRRFDREMGAIAPKQPAVSTPGALPC